MSLRFFLLPAHKMTLPEFFKLHTKDFSLKRSEKDFSLKHSEKDFDFKNPGILFIKELLRDFH